MGIYNWLVEAVNANPEFILIGVVTVIEIVPIKINPWTAALKWIGDRVNGDLRKEVTELKREFELKNASDMRWDILNFANACRNGREHCREEWNHVIDQIKSYETYVEEKEIDNGVMEEATKYLRRLYHELIEKNGFL